jgi:hypothetical protein
MDERPWPVACKKCAAMTANAGCAWVMRGWIGTLMDQYASLREKVLFEMRSHKERRHARNVSVRRTETRRSRVFIITSYIIELLETHGWACLQLAYIKNT